MNESLNTNDDFFKEMIKIGVIFPKINVKLPKCWTKITQSIYNNEDNFAILTGKINDIIVIDLDKKDDEFIGLKWIEEHFGSLQNIDTLITKTINHGYHLFFKYTSKLKNVINAGQKNIDILSDKKCCYQGTGYDIVNNKEIRPLSDQEIKLVLQLIKNKNVKEKTQIIHLPIEKDPDPGSRPELTRENDDVLINNKSYEKANKILNLPIDTNWTIVKNDNGHKAVPKCLECLINPCKKHSQEQHSSLFINSDSSVIKSCFSCGSIVMDKRNSKKIRR